MPSPVRIRPARPEDTPLILQLIRGLAEYEKLLPEVTATEADLRATLFGPKAYAEVLIASYGEQDAGFALFFHNYSTFLGKPGIYLEDLFVRPGLRGHGIGKALLRELARIAVARGCGRLEWSVLGWNRPAIEFYESFGARPMSDWTVYRLAGESLRRFAAREDRG